VDFPAVSVDGRSVVADGSTRVPAGRHQLRVAHEGYVPTTRAVSLSPGENTERVWLDATPQLRAEHADRVRRQRTVAYVIGGVGLAAMAGGAALLVTGLADRSAADDEVTRIADLKTCVMTNPGLCPPMSMLPAMLADSQDALRNATAWAITGGVVLGLGTAALVVGSVLRARSDPSDRYDRPAGWGVAVGFGGASLRGTF
jgi:hypothetical protein